MLQFKDEIQNHHFQGQGEIPHICPNCGGHGDIAIRHITGDPQLEKSGTCPECDGDGYISSGMAKDEYYELWNQSVNLLMNLYQERRLADMQCNWERSDRLNKLLKMARDRANRRFEDAYYGFGRTPAGRKIAAVDSNGHLIDCPEDPF